MLKLSSSKTLSIDACQIFKVITDYDEGKRSTVSTHAEGGGFKFGCLAWIGREGDLSEGGCAWRGLEFAILRMAASHGLIAYGDLSEEGCAWHGIESAILRMAASHGFEP